MCYDLVSNLREMAKLDAKKGEYHPEEHTCWLAADRIVALQAMIAGQRDPQLLHEIATRLWHKEQHEQVLETNNQRTKTKVRGSGTG